MCGPMIPVFMAVASTALAVGGDIYSGKVASANAKYSAQIADRNAALSRRAAKDAVERGDKETVAHAREVAQLRGAQRAEFAAAGLDTSFGSPLDVLSSTSIMGMGDMGRIQDNAQREASGYIIEAANYDAEAQSQRANAKNAVTSSLITAGSDLFAGASKIGGYMQKYGKVGGGTTAGKPQRQEAYGGSAA